MKKVKVKIAVAVGEDGQWFSCGSSILRNAEAVALKGVPDGQTRKTYWVEVELGVPEVAK